MLIRFAGIISFLIGTVVVTASVASVAQPASAAGQVAVYANVASQGDPAAVFSAKCASCHGEGLEGGDGAVLIGPGNPVFTYRSGDALLRYVMENMPDDNPGSYDPAEYVAAVNFVLFKNGIALPAEGLTAENAGSISFGP